QRGRLAPKPRRRQPGGLGNAGPELAAPPPRRSRYSPSAALGRLPGAALPRRVLAGIAGRPARPDPLPPGRRRLDDRAAVVVTIRRPEIPNGRGWRKRRDVAGLRAVAPSVAAKWPPLDVRLQRRTLYRRSARSRGSSPSGTTMCGKTTTAV